MTSPNNVPTVKFWNGYSMPMLGLGTDTSKDGDAGQAVKDAIDLGYRHINTAWVYGNEEEIGTAIKEKIADGTVKREELFVTTKLWNNSHKEERVIPACKRSLENLGLDYVDLYLVHSPMACEEDDDAEPQNDAVKTSGTDTDYLETWRGMEECVRQGFARSIGVSNFNSEQVERLIKSATIKPVNNQVECNIHVPQRELIEFCRKFDVTVTGHSPLGKLGDRHGNASSLDDPKISNIAEKYSKTPAQVALRYVYQQGAAPIPKSVTKSRIKENIEIFDFNLTDVEMLTIESMATGERLVRFAFAMDQKYWPFRIPF